MVQNLFFWLASLPIIVSAPLVIGSGVVLSLIGSYVASNLYTEAELQGNNTVGGPKFTFIGQVYSVTLLFALVGAWDVYQSARGAVQREAAALIALDTSARVFSDASQEQTREDIHRTIRQYGKAVAEKEWRTMSYGLDDPEATHRYNQMVDLFTSIEPLTASQVAVQQNAVRWLAEISEHRLLRVGTLSNTLIGLIWALILTGALVSIAFTWFFGSANGVAQTAMSAIIAAFIMLHLLVILKLTHPFVGETAIAPYPILQVTQ